MWGWGPEQRHVVVAVIFDARQGFFVSFNEKWGGYAFPMRKRREGEPGDVTALAALRDAAGLSLLRATASPLEYLEYRRNSGRTGRDTWYFYQAYEVNPGEPLPGGELAARNGFLGYEQLMAPERVVTWSTRALARELMEHQQVAVAVIARQGPAGREYLMLHNERSGGYFFPASRRKTDEQPTSEALEAVRRDTGYRGALAGGAARFGEDRRFSQRFGRERRFVYHAVAINLPGVDLSVSPSPLEESLNRGSVAWRWVSEAELANPGEHGLSASVTPLLPLLPR
jgi:hypothetical protein